MKLFLDFEKVEDYINIHRNMQIPFTLTVTNYTTRITSNYCDVHFLRSSQGKAMFAAYAMIKADVSRFLPPDVDKAAMQYYKTGFLNPVSYPTVYNFDLKSAYATCLKNAGFIRPKTFNYLSRLPKLDRLAAVGMLAGRKTVFKMNADGKPISEETVVSPLENFFFYCVQEIGYLMNTAASYMGNSFLFTWVDGIFFLPSEKQVAENYFKIMRGFFKEKGYNTSFETLNNFEALSFKDHWKVSFDKEGKRKIYSIPKAELDLKKRVSEYLLTKEYNKLRQNKKVIINQSQFKD